MYCGLCTASEVFLIFTTQLYLCLCNKNAIVLKREVLQQEYSQPPILPSPHFRWVVKEKKKGIFFNEEMFVFATNCLPEKKRHTKNQEERDEKVCLLGKNSFPW